MYICVESFFQSRRREVQDWRDEYGINHNGAMIDEDFASDIYVVSVDVKAFSRHWVD